MGRLPVLSLRSRRPLVGLVAATALVAGIPAAATPAAAATGPAPGSPGQAATWSPGDKDGFGTAIHSPRSKVWYTLNNGTLSEIYYPRIDTEGTRDTQFVVSDGATFTDREDSSTTKRRCWSIRAALVYRQIDTATVRQVPHHQDVRHRPGALGGAGRRAVRVAHRQAVRALRAARRRPVMTGNDDTGRSAHGGLAAVLRRHATPAPSSPPPAFSKTSSGYLGTSDGWTDLATDHALDRSYDAHRAAATSCRPAGSRLTGLPEPPATSPSRSASAAHGRAAALPPPQARSRRGFAAAADGVRRGLAQLPRQPRAGPPRRAALADRVDGLGDGARRQRGQDRAAAASSRHPDRPWAWANELQYLAVYHAVWSRDLYQIATGCSRSATTPRPNRALDYLWTVQQRRRRLVPAELAARRRRRCSAACRWTRSRSRSCSRTSSAAPAPATGRTSRRSADFLVAHGPRTPQERWENIGRLLTRDHRRRDRRPGLRRRHRARKNGDDAPRGDVPGRRPTRGSSSSSDGRPPRTGRCTRRRRTTCGSPTNGDPERRDDRSRSPTADR